MPCLQLKGSHGLGGFPFELRGRGPEAARRRASGEAFLAPSRIRTGGMQKNEQGSSSRRVLVILSYLQEAVSEAGSSPFPHLGSSPTAVPEQAARRSDLPSTLAPCLWELGGAHPWPVLASCATRPAVFFLDLSVMGVGFASSSDEIHQVAIDGGRTVCQVPSGGKVRGTVVFTIVL